MANSSWESALVGWRSNASVSLFVDHWHTHNPVTEQQDGPIYILIKNHGCKSKDELLGNFPTAQECAEVWESPVICRPEPPVLPCP